jgi:BirA family biotin operon repressor/biotin-[acetyl-CoA-carboxylase] ligase
MDKELRYIGQRHFHYEATDSTNTRAAEMAQDPSNAGVVITAGIQAQGRGQHGRRWQSVAGTNVLLSALLFPPTPLRRPSLLTPFAAVAVAETIGKFTPHRPRIKWPNDVLVDGKKICGILIEGGTAPSGSPYFIVGIGLNVNQSQADFDKQSLPHATSLAVLLGRSLEVAEVTQVLIQSLDLEYERLMQGELGLLESRWREGIGLMEKDVSIEQMDGTFLTGRLKEMTFDHLLLETPFGIDERFLPEEVRHVH